ncbi:MAG: hypothetical protein B7Z58_10190 [Acidiphilium sp. 37-64-53]|uniref:hypothetical protein n=1 Tax=Acidiphilium TaxID=522 RepID=UPI000BD5D8B0|nr:MULTISPECIES: hypothetical protein [Acidiphilium]OYW01794.1 MAG: hypothetical protein B7Z58_10190 [Acidiphilium sp. 37-64-53]OZB27338.1 MAG: hypothetical protein B7X49_11415 [Acidiphilium sp. 34-64-41]HQT85673.1 hypothetical protein [Acidiphilium rubrum]
MTETHASDNSIVRFTEAISGLRHHAATADDQSKLTQAVVNLILTLIEQIIQHFASLAARTASPANPPEPTECAAPSGLNGPMNALSPTLHNRPKQPNAPHPIAQSDASVAPPVRVAQPSPNPAITARTPRRALAQTPLPAASAHQSHPAVTNPPPSRPRTRISHPNHSIFTRPNRYDIKTNT